MAEATSGDLTGSKDLLLVAYSGAQNSQAELAAAPLIEVRDDPTPGDQDTLEAWLDAAFAAL